MNAESGPLYILQVVEDNEMIFQHFYTSGFEATQQYNKFVDHGNARHSRQVVLVEPDNKVHAKVFQTPRLEAAR